MSKKGFTTMEMMICIGIVGLLSAIGYPSILYVSRNNEFRAEVLNLVSNLQRAKIAAVEQNSDVVIVMSATGYQIFVDDGRNGGIAGDWLRQPTEKMLFASSLLKGLLLSNNFSLSRTRFTGRVGTKAGSIFIENQYGRKKSVVINTVGRVRVEDL